MTDEQASGHRRGQYSLDSPVRRVVEVLEVEPVEEVVADERVLEDVNARGAKQSIAKRLDEPSPASASRGRGGVGQAASGGGGRGGRG